MNITAKDVGLVRGKVHSVGTYEQHDGSLVKGVLIEFTEPAKWPISSVFEKWDVEISAVVNQADAPEPKPPETVERRYDMDEYWRDTEVQQPRPDLAGQTFIYRLEGVK